jgi:hypothetical protein
MSECLHCDIGELIAVVTAPRSLPGLMMAGPRLAAGGAARKRMKPRPRLEESSLGPNVVNDFASDHRCPS